MQRYTRQILLPNFGVEAQQKLSESKVLVVGAGGLGVPVLQYLAAAGIGKLGIADGDAIEISNLQRQVLYSESEIGQNKALVAKEKLSQLNSEIEIVAYSSFITTENIFDIIDSYDVVVDCTDRFSVRYLVNDVCYLLKKPLVFASIYQYEVQLSVFHYGDNPYNLRDLFADIEDENLVPNCNEAGILGTVTAIAGSLQAHEVIKVITKIGKVNSGSLMIFNSLNFQMSIFSIPKSSEKFTPKNRDEVLRKNYGIACETIFSIDNLQELKAILDQKNTVLIDVREKEELPKITQLPVTEIPLGELAEHCVFLQKFDTIVLICKSGVRSKKAIHWLQNMNFDKSIFSVENGIEIFRKD